MASKQHEMSFRLQAQMGGGFSSTFNKAQKELVSLQKEIDALNKTQGNINAYQKHTKAVEEQTKKLERYNQIVSNTKNEIKRLEQVKKELSSSTKDTGTAIADTEKALYELNNQLLREEQAVSSTSTNIENKEKKLKELDAALKKAGIDTSNFAEESNKLGSEMETLSKKQEEAAIEAENFGNKVSSALADAGQALAALGAMAALKKIRDELKECADASIEFESVMAGARRTLGGAEDEIAALGAEFKTLSTEIPITTQELGEIAETAGQLGVAKEYAAEFTEVMATLATTTDLTADNAATMLAQFANITGLEDYERLGSTVAELGDATATTASKVVDMAQGIAATANIAGMAETDILGISAAVGSLGIEAQAGSTAMSTLIQTLFKAVEQGGEELQEFAAIAGMTASEFASAWRDDAASALTTFIEGLNNTEAHGRSAIVILEELGITNQRQVKAILGLVNAEGLLSDSISQANAAWDENTALAEKSAIMYETTEAKLQMRANSFNNLKVAIGDAYTPALKQAYEMETEALKSLTSFVETNPAVVRGLTATAAVLGGVTAALALYTAGAKVAAVATTALVAAIPGAKTIMAFSLIVAGLTGAYAALNSETEQLRDESHDLTAASRAQYKEIRTLEEEYHQVSSAMGETSKEAEALQQEIDELNTDFNSNKQTLEQYRVEHEKLMDDYEQMSSSHQSKRDQLEKEAQSTQSLISELEELGSSTKRATANKQEMLAIIDSLNERIPGLALNYDDIASSAGDFAGALNETAEAYAAQKKLQQNWEEYIDRLAERDSLKEARDMAKANAEIAQAELEAAEKAYKKAQDIGRMQGGGGASFSKEEREALAEAEAARDEYNKAVDETSAAYKENKDALAQLKGEADAYDQQLEEAALNEYREQLEQVAEQYGLTADELEQMVDASGGKLDEWVAFQEEFAAAAAEATEAVINSFQRAETSTGDTLSTMLSNVSSNADDYVEYTQLMAEMSGSMSGEAIAAFEALGIRGLSALRELNAGGEPAMQELNDTMAKAAEAGVELVASKYESGEIPDAVKKANTDAAQAVAESTELEEAFEGQVDGAVDVITEKAPEFTDAGSETITSLVSGVDGETANAVAAYDELMTACVAAVNAKKGAFRKAGADSVQGIINGANSMKRQVVEAYTAIAQSAVNAVNSTLKINSPSKVLAESGAGGVEGLIVGAKSLQDEYVKTMKEVTLAGADAVSAEQAQLVAFAPELMASMASRSARNAASTYGGSGAAAIQITYSPVYNLGTTETADTLQVKLQRHDADFARRVLTVVNDASADAARRAFR